MSRSGPILVIEDDTDDQELLEQAFRELEVPNPRVYFTNCPDAIAYLLKMESQPFLIFSDMNLPGMNGAELKRMINGNETLKRKAIPFVFFTTTADRDAVNEAYKEMSQGFFEKPHDMTRIKKLIGMIVQYWKACKHPNSEWV
ncbi:response regulator [Flaviaesturariibacter amylovorans]|uniref:Response regulatory domain-containing protein n=1 Tax=Flaviaesturariibacter amylovorans TaxID=1084520 RepID=A0ABP8HHI0_9BACT